ncbi:sensor histidine kinase [Flavobacterium algicola]|uniref:sensor histidine kinase n=1 Tax=Flavobacterium algicola TaxID=556529 RepID=UPI001EFD2F00|nr:HAMP domain-containing sensor histidine kinase [Flavobacterium algicola]MCG9792271.1 HAMP domain-containing histidine kinase [Flavobacterium algicola]
MKLLSKTNRYYILSTIPILLISSVFIYFFLLHEIGESNESILLMRVKVIEKHIQKENNLLLNVFDVNNEVYVKKIKNIQTRPQIIKDTLIYSEINDELIAHKMIIVNSEINGQHYEIKVLKSTIENEELLEVVFVVFSSFLILLLLVNTFINIKISQSIWKPFTETLHYIKNFNVSNPNHEVLESNDIEEFNELNNSINLMTSKMISDYKNQKRFSENASHEFQTPLAIIKGKIDLLLQENTLNKQTMETLISIEEASNRLSRINKSLLLLSKIENQQFDKREVVAVRPLIEKIVSVNEDFVIDKQLLFESNIHENLSFLINSELAFILLNNLIQNAIRHNIVGGEISIWSTSDAITISNTGDLHPLHESLIFERFEKKSSNSNSIGLGLAIVKEIAEANSIKISYFYTNNQHHFVLSQLRKL